MQNLTAFLAYHARLTPDRCAVIFDDRRISYAELENRVLSLAGWLAGHGIGSGDIVALVMKNSPAFLEFAFAVSHLGAVLLPVNYRLSPEEFTYIHDHAGVVLIAADSEFASTVEGFAGAVLLDADARADTRTLAGERAPPPPPVPRGSDDLYRLMYTSGTTAHPKGVMHSYANSYWKCADHVIALGLSASDRLLVCGPLYHVGAFDLPGIAVLWMGGTWCLLREFSPAAALGAIERHRLTCAWLAPVMLRMCLDLDEGNRYDLASMQWVIGGGEKTPEARIRAFGTLFANARYIDGYGLTESCSGDTLMEPGRELEKIGSVGRPLAHVRVQIRDDDGRPLAAGQTGEICLAGPRITRGYWRDAERTREAFHGDGWFRTGDVGHLDGDGFLYLTDRSKDMIISGGENIASSEVERVLHEYPAIAEAAVIGRPDERWGERPVAVVVPRTGAGIVEDDVIRHCRGALAGFKVPSEIHVVGELPRNPSGKVLKRILRDAFATGKTVE